MDAPQPLTAYGPDGSPYEIKHGEPPPRALLNMLRNAQGGIGGDM